MPLVFRELIIPILLYEIKNCISKNIEDVGTKKKDSVEVEDLVAGWVWTHWLHTSMYYSGGSVLWASGLNTWHFCLSSRFIQQRSRNSLISMSVNHSLCLSVVMLAALFLCTFHGIMGVPFAMKLFPSFYTCMRRW